VIILPFNPRPDKVPAKTFNLNPLALFSLSPILIVCGAIIDLAQKYCLRANEQLRVNRAGGILLLRPVNIFESVVSMMDWTTYGFCIGDRVADKAGPGGTNRFVTMPEHAPPPAALKYGSLDEATVVVVVIALHFVASLEASKV